MFYYSSQQTIQCVPTDRNHQLCWISTKKSQLIAVIITMNWVYVTDCYSRIITDTKHLYIESTCMVDPPPMTLVILTIRRPRRPPHMISLCVTVEPTSDSQRHLINDLKNHNRDLENNKSGWMQILWKVWQDKKVGLVDQFLPLSIVWFS